MLKWRVYTDCSLSATDMVVQCWRFSQRSFLSSAGLPTV